MTARGEASRFETLPYGVGRLTGGWALLVVALLALVGWGAYAYSRQFVEGKVVTGMRDIGTMGGATWGLYIAFDVYFAGVGFAGITVAALIRLLNLNALRAVARMAELLTVITLILGAFSVLADLGQPLRALINLPLYARPQSPFFGTFTLAIAGFLFGSLVYLYLAGRRDAYLMARYDTPLRPLYRAWAAGYRDTPAQRERHRKTTFWLAIAIIPLLITTHSTLGLVFGLQVGRPGWYSALQAPAFVVLAGVSGVGLLLVIAAILRGYLREEQRLGTGVFRWLGAFLLVLTLAYLYFVVVEVLTAFYAGHHHEQELTQLLLWGAYAPVFWGSVLLLALPAGLLLLQAITGRWNIPALVACGVMVNLAAIGKRYLIVVPSQTHMSLLPYGPGFYAPTWVEYSIIVGLFALGALLYALFVKVFPIMDVPEEGVR
jgi:molybdopterin-containing oxidoreductase family membrane subunit